MLKLTMQTSARRPHHTRILGSRLLVLGVGASALLLAACGQKGALYLANPAGPASTSASSPGGSASAPSSNGAAR